MRLISMLTALVSLTSFSAGAYERELERRFGIGVPASNTLTMLSSTDIERMAPLVEGFIARTENVGIHYIQASSLEVYKAVIEREKIDLVISSAMDLQTKLANDGYARPYRSAATAALPDWAIWRDRLFGVTEEPAVMVYSATAFPADLPRTRTQLIRRIRREPEAYRGRIASYDPKGSGLGYLFATQDAQQSDVFWRLAEVIGGLSPRLSKSSAEMIGWADRDEIGVAYNVLGSYAERLRDNGAKIRVVAPEDYTLMMLRTALIPKGSVNAQLAGQFIDFLLSGAGRVMLAEKAGLKPITLDGEPFRNGVRPIVLGPGLLVYLDRLKKRNFLRAWHSIFADR